MPRAAASLAIAIALSLCGCNTYTLTVYKIVIESPGAQMNSTTEASGNTASPATEVVPTIEVPLIGG